MVLFRTEFWLSKVLVTWRIIKETHSLGKQLKYLVKSVGFLSVKV